MAQSHYMKRAIELAAKGRGWVNPNPQVGAVLVKEERIIGEGYHKKYGEAHAERNVLASASESPAGATLYVTLEPCCHSGKTPPCTKAIIDAGITRVIVGSNDPNPEVAGKGLAELKAAGIEIITQCMQGDCDRLNQIFFNYIKTNTPYVMLKYAMTLDGKIATRTGASQWITGSEARADVHRQRGRYRSVMVGAGTVATDDPLLTSRLEGERTPLRIVCDSNLSIALDSQIVTTASSIATLIATTVRESKKAEALMQAGCKVLVVPAKAGRVDLGVLMKELGKQQIDSVLIEGGATLNGAALEAGIVNKVRSYIAPKLFGGASAPSPVAGFGVAHPDESFVLSNLVVEHFGNDFCIEGEVN